jgi:hypothetical protein
MAPAVCCGLAVSSGCAPATAYGMAAAPVPRLIDEDEALRIEVELTLEPVFAPLQDIRTVLFARMGGLFEC